MNEVYQIVNIDLPVGYLKRDIVPVHYALLCLLLLSTMTSTSCSRLQEGLNGVNRQPLNGKKINRQLSKRLIFDRQPSKGLPIETLLQF